MVPISSPRIPGEKRPSAAASSGAIPMPPPAVVEACKVLLSEVQASDAVGRAVDMHSLANVAVFKDSAAMLAAPSPVLTKPDITVCRHSLGCALSDTDHCLGGPVVQLLDGILACLEWRLLAAAPVVRDFVDMMDAGRRKWSVQEMNVCARRHCGRSCGSPPA